VRGGRWIALCAGVAVVAVHAAAFPWLVERFDRSPLTVRVRATMVAPGPALSVAAEIPGDAAARARLLVDGQEIGPAAAAVDLARPPGLHRVEWRARYRGGVERRVGWTQLVGPFQDPARPPCSARLLVGQRFLDDGRAGPGTLAHLLARLVEHQMSGFEAFPVGSFERVRAVSMRWASRAGEEGHVRVVLELGFTRAALELTIRIAPHLAGKEIALSSRTEARVRLRSRLVQWVSDLIRGDEIAGRMARREIGAALDDIMTAPPPLPLGSGRVLQLGYCPDRDIEVVDGSHAAVPLAVALATASAAARRAGRATAPILLPADLGSAPAAMTAPLAIELDGNALNGLLYVLWASGYLEEALATSGIVDRFHRDPIVAELLSVRARGPWLPLPPTLVPSPRAGQSYEIGVASSLWLEDVGLRTPAHIFGRAGFSLTARSDVPRAGAPRLSLHDLGLTCEPEPGLLEPCYPELAASLIERAPEVHGELSAWFGEVLAELLIDREIAPSGSGAQFRLRRSAIRSPPAGRHGPLRIDLIGQLEALP
jgi:hypothetical protein